MSLSPFANPEFDSPQPVAWLACAADGSESSAVYALKEQADAAARDWGWLVAPLYAAPPTHATPGDGNEQGGCTLTDAERQAVTEASGFFIGTRTGVTLSNLLERAK